VKGGASLCQSGSTPHHACRPSKVNSRRILIKSELAPVLNLLPRWPYLSAAVSTCSNINLAQTLPDSARSARLCPLDGITPAAKETSSATWLVGLPAADQVRNGDRAHELKCLVAQGEPRGDTMLQCVEVQLDEKVGQVTSIMSSSLCNKVHVKSCDRDTAPTFFL